MSSAKESVSPAARSPAEAVLTPSFGPVGFLTQLAPAFTLLIIGSVALLGYLVADNAAPSLVAFAFGCSLAGLCWCCLRMWQLRRSVSALERAAQLAEDRETTLRLSEERFRALTELNSDWYWETDAEHRFSMFSRPSTLLTQLSRDEVIGRKRWELYPDALTQEDLKTHLADLGARVPFYRLLSRTFDPATGAITGYFHISGRPFFDAGGSFLGYRGIGQDISARHSAELALAAKTQELVELNDRLRAEAALRQAIEHNVLLAIERALAQVGLELHDDLGQDLTGIALLTKSLEKKLSDRGLAETGDAAHISELVNRTIRHTRMLSHGLSPYIWGPKGLLLALSQLAADINTLGNAHCETRFDGEIEIKDEIVARTFFRIAQEATNNAVKHAQARKLIVALKSVGKGIQLSIADDGAARAMPGALGKKPAQHSIRHRASAIGAVFSQRVFLKGGVVVCVRWQPNPLVQELLSQNRLVEGAR